MVSILEKEKTLNNPKDAPPSSDEENEPLSIDIRTILEVGHPIIVHVRMIEDSLQQHDDHNSVEHSDIHAREPSRKIRKDHHVVDIIGD